MIATSTTATVPFTPGWRLGKPDAPVFYLRAGSVIERGMMEAEIAGTYNAARVYANELQEAAIEGVTVLLAGDDEFDRVLELIEREVAAELAKLKAAAAPAAERAGLQAEADVLALTDPERRLLSETRGVLAEHWPEYRELLARIERRREIAPIVALRRFCVGWERAANDAGRPAVFARGPDGLVTEAALAALSPIELSVAGNRAYALQYVSEEAAGNSRPRSSSDGDQETLPVGEGSPAAGSSAKRTSRKTPA